MPLIQRRVRKVMERDLMQDIRAALAKMPDVVVFRNNTGMLEDRHGTKVRYGLAIGSADLIGSLKMGAFRVDYGGGGLGLPGTGVTFARALAIEVKQPGEKPTVEQAAWLTAMQGAGWLTGVAHSVDEAVAIVESGRRWER